MFCLRIVYLKICSSANILSLLEIYRSKVYLSSECHGFPQRCSEFPFYFPRHLASLVFRVDASPFAGRATVSAESPRRDGVVVVAIAVAMMLSIVEKKKKTNKRAAGTAQLDGESHWYSRLFASLTEPHRRRTNTPEAADISLRSMASRKTANRNSINPD